MEAKHPIEALLQTARNAFGAVAGSLDQRLLTPSGDLLEAGLNRLQLVPKADFDRLKTELEAVRQELARLEERLKILAEDRQPGQ